MNCIKIFIDKKLFLKDFGPFLTPHLRGQPLLFDIGRKIVKFQTIFIQQMFRNSLPFFSYSEKYISGADPVTPLWGRLSKKWKVHIVNSIILSKFCSIMFFKMLVVFEIYGVKDGPILAPKIPYYVTYDPKFLMYR